MAKDKNIFGGGNPHGLYVPMSEDEQETIQRIIDSQTIRIVVHPWNMVVTPSWIGVGDKRVAVKFGLAFTAPETLIPVKSLDIELQAYGGVTLLRRPYPTIMPDGSPMLIGAGLSVELQWDIAIDHIDPRLVKAVKPGAKGLTSRRIDPDTKERTPEGNLRYKGEKRAKLRVVDAADEKMRRSDAEKVRKLEGQ